MGDRLPRKLAAILYADVAGYSRLTGDDEDATHRRLSEYLDLVSDTVERHRGRVMHYAGDAVLADGRFLVGTSKIGARTVFRPAFSNWRTRPEDVEELANVVVEVAESLALPAVAGEAK